MVAVTVCHRAAKRPADASGLAFFFTQSVADISRHTEAGIGLDRTNEGNRMITHAYFIAPLLLLAEP